MNKYQEQKQRARFMAQEWQRLAGERNMSYGELADATATFEKLGKRYGLLKEFRENGII